MNPMRLDVIIPTHNRATLLGRTLQSLLDAEHPPELDVTVTVVDNRSTDTTREAVRSFEEHFKGRLRYVYEPQPGRSHALNAGIAATNGDLVGMIDDDEQVDGRWFLTIRDAFQDQSTDFIGGPYLPVWSVERPAWISNAYGSAVGWVDGGSDVQQFGPSCNAMLMGGNAVIRRSLLERVGPYAADLGRTPGGRLLSCEDEDMFARLLAAGGRGFYRPDLIIHHYVPAERMTKQYFRRWCFWRGVSQGVIDRKRRAPVRYLLGVPRYMFGVALRGTWDSLRMLFRGGDPARLFKNELAWWDLAGFMYGKHLSGFDRWITNWTRQTRGDVPSAATSPLTPPRS
jgi:glycosyltransferase involved in cell wall biosynthesis